MIRVASLLIALFPILQFYSLGGIPLVLLVGGLFCFTTLIGNRGFFKIKPDVSFVFIYPWVLFILSLNGFFVLENSRVLASSLLGVLIDTVIYLVLWNEADSKHVLRYMDIIGYIAIGFCIVQAVCIVLHVTVPSGRIPFLALNGNQTWVPETWGFRFNSIFSEPSYLAIYLLPLFACHYYRNENFASALYALGILLSSSSLGIIGCVFIFLYSELTIKRETRERLCRLLVFICIGCIVLSMLFIFTPTRTMIKRSFDKISEIGTNDTSRLTGHIKYFSYYSFKEILFGVGQGQFSNYMTQLGFDLSNYSNSFVMTLLQYGLVGFVSLILFLIILFYYSVRKGNSVFFFVLLLVLATDYIILSSRYYYLLYFVICYEGGNTLTRKEVINEE